MSKVQIFVVAFCLFFTSAMGQNCGCDCDPPQVCPLAMDEGAFCPAMEDSVAQALRDACGAWNPNDKNAQDAWFATVMAKLHGTSLRNQNWIGEGTSCPCGGWSMRLKKADQNSVCLGTLANRNFFLLLEVLETDEKSQEVLKIQNQQLPQERHKRNVVEQKNAAEEVIVKSYSTPAGAENDADWTLKEMKGACPNETTYNIMKGVCQNCPNPCTASTMAAEVHRQLGGGQYAVEVTGSLYTDNADCGHKTNHFETVKSPITMNNFCDLMCGFGNMWVNMVVTDPL